MDENVSNDELLREVLKRGVKELPKSDLIHGKTTCPHCGYTGSILKEFGLRIMRGTLVPQSWCRDCRALQAYARTRYKRRGKKTH